METDEFFTIKEKDLLFSLYRKLLQLSGETLQKGDCKKLKIHLVNTIQNNRIQRDIFGLNPVIKDMQTAVIVAEEIGMKRASILGLMLHDSVRCGTLHRSGSGANLWRGCGRHHPGIDTCKRTLFQKPYHRVREFPQLVADFRRGHACHSHYDCRPRKHHAANQGLRK